MQTGMEVHDTDQKDGNIMNINPNRDKSSKEKQMKTITRLFDVFGG
jgi:hypothetical protein